MDQIETLTKRLEHTPEQVRSGEIDAALQELDVKKKGMSVADQYELLDGLRRALTLNESRLNLSFISKEKLAKLREKLPSAPVMEHLENYGNVALSGAKDFGNKSLDTAKDMSTGAMDTALDIGSDAVSAVTKYPKLSMVLGATGVLWLLQAIRGTAEKEQTGFFRRLLKNTLIATGLVFLANVGMKYFSPATAAAAETSPSDTKPEVKSRAPEKAAPVAAPATKETVVAAQPRTTETPKKALEAKAPEAAKGKAAAVGNGPQPVAKPAPETKKRTAETATKTTEAAPAENRPGIRKIKGFLADGTLAQNEQSALLSDADVKRDLKNAPPAEQEELLLSIMKADTSNELKANLQKASGYYDPATNKWTWFEGTIVGKLGKIGLSSDEGKMLANVYLRLKARGLAA